MAVSGGATLALIADYNCRPDVLGRAIADLGAVDEPPDFWRRIAESDAFSRLHRRQCVFQLFYRHVRAGMSLSQLAGVLGTPVWLAEADLFQIEDLGGHIPVELTFDNTVFVFNILPEPGREPEQWRVYLSVEGHIRLEDFRQLLQGEVVDSATRQAAILEIGFSPAVIESVRGKSGNSRSLT